MKTPTAEQLRLAAFWLKSNDGDEAPTMQAVAAWLERKAAGAEFATLAKEAGVPVELARRRLAAKGITP